MASSRGNRKRDARAWAKATLVSQRERWPDTDGMPPHHMHSAARRRYEESTRTYDTFED